MVDTLIKIIVGMLLGFFGLITVASSFDRDSKYTPDHDMPVFAVFVEVVPRMVINQRCQEIMKSTKNTVDEKEILDGCASWIVETQKCHIVVPEPATSDGFVNQRMLAIWGHEILHCTKGSFHD